MKNLVDKRDYSVIVYVSRALGDLSQCSEYFAQVLHEMFDDDFTASDRVHHCRHYLSLCHSSFNRVHTYLSWYEELLINLENKIDGFAGSDFGCSCEGNDAL